MENSQINKINSVAEILRNKHGFVIENLIMEFLYPRCENCKKFIRNNKDFFIVGIEFDFEKAYNIGVLDSVLLIYESCSINKDKITKFKYRNFGLIGSPPTTGTTGEKYIFDNVHKIIGKRGFEKYIINNLVILIQQKIKNNLACSEECCSIKLKKHMLETESIDKDKYDINLQKMLDESLF